MEVLGYMSIFDTVFWTNLLSIIVIDLVLAGDNAILIGLAARNVPHHQQKKVIIIGMIGAILVRSGLTLGVMWLLEVPYLKLVGGLFLVWIGFKLLIDDGEDNDVKGSRTIWGAVGTIILADLVMGLDNVLAVAGAADSHPLLVILGLLVSIPIVVWGSTIILKFIERFPIIIYIGSGVILWTATKMITEEEHFASFFEQYPVIHWGFVAVVIVGVLALGYFTKHRKMRKASASAAALSGVETAHTESVTSPKKPAHQE
jgi:YjbE family integral membrane protein